MKVILVEGGINRVMKHVQHGSYGIISAARANLSKKANKARNKALAGDIRALGLGFKKTIGRGQEEVNGKTISSREHSFIVHGMKKKAAVQLAKKHDQDYVIHGQGGRATLLQIRKGKKDYPAPKAAKKAVKWTKAVKGAATYDTAVKRKGGHNEPKGKDVPAFRFESETMKTIAKFLSAR